MTDHLTENARLRAALKRWQSYGCPDCSGDCGSANPPMPCCIMQETADALATPAPDAVMEAGVYTARGIGDLQQLVCNLSQQGFRIIAVIDTQNGDYHVVAQREGR